MMKNLLIASLLVLGAQCATAQTWTPKKAPLMTTWGESLDPNDVHSQYPRPVMQRDQWMNLNGVWQFQQAMLGDALPVKGKLKETILVPFPWESALSGIMRQLDSERAWYKRSFVVPANWSGQTIMLNFGAVDWRCEVFINGRFVGKHDGGYDPFSFDVTPFVTTGKANEIIVNVYDPGNNEAIAYGKQNNARFADPKGYAYSPSSGIWQTVWLEPVPTNHITHICLTPDIDNQKLNVMVNSFGRKNIVVRASVYDGSKRVAQAEGGFNRDFAVVIPQPKLWSTDDPFLYDVVVELCDSSGLVLDKVKSYAGMRKISLKNENGVQRLALNNEFVFQMGPLDQGYWPDGLYTAPSDEALRWEVENIKRYGYNMVRKHIKVEPQRWYYWCDKLGLLVWQDMPSTFKERNEADKTQFETELTQMIRSYRNHPSIVNWIVFNEHWGSYDVERMTNYVIGLDPSRLVTGNSGVDARKPSIDFEVGHIKDNHSYRPPHVPLISSRRATVNGEYGAIGYLYEGHVWDTDGPWVHFNYSGSEAATAEYEKFIGQIIGFTQRGLSAAVYTQWTDVENEMNGLYTYDRKEMKLDRERVAAANRSTYVKSSLINEQTDAQNLK